MTRRLTVLLVVSLALAGFRSTATASSATSRGGPEVGSSTSAPPAAGGSATSDDSVSELLSISGLKQQAEWQALSARQQLQLVLGQLDGHQRAALDRIASEAFGAEAFTSAVRDAISTRLDERRVAEALGWFRSSLGRKITNAELGAMMGRGGPEHQEFASRLQTTPPPRARVALLDRLDSATAASDTAVEMVVAVTEGMTRVLERRLPADQRTDAALRQAQIAQLRAQVAGSMRTALLAANLFTYRMLTDRELELYLGFAESPSGRWFAGAVYDGLLRAMRAAAEQTAEGLIAVLPPAGGSPRFRKPPLPRDDGHL